MGYVSLQECIFNDFNGLLDPQGDDVKENSQTLFGLERFSHSPFLRVCVASTNVMFEAILGQKHDAYLEASWAINEPNKDPNLYLGNGCEITSAIH